MNGNDEFNRQLEDAKLKNKFCMQDLNFEFKND